MGQTLNSNLYQSFHSQFPDEPGTALLTTEAGQVYTYEDAEQRSAKVANTLVQMGLKKGDRVSVQVEKSPEMLWLYLGVIRAGMVFHPLNTAYTNSELDYFLTNAEPSLVVCDSSKEADFIELCRAADIAHLMTLNADGTGSLQDKVTGQSEQFDTIQNEPGDLAALLYSSGTTGRPKGIMLSHQNLAENARVLVEYWGFTSNDCLLHSLPIFHIHGLFVAIGCVLMSGASMRWLPKFDVTTVLSNLPKSTVMMGVPTYYTRLLASSEFTSQTAKNMRLFISGSAPLLADTFKEFEQRTRHSILERYGMSETGMNTSNPLNGERRAGTVGFPLPGVEARVTDLENNILPSNEVGDLQVKGKNVFSGYWKMPEKTAEDFTGDGFFVTGDKASVDDDGYVSIVGRSKDMIICGGLNVYPKEIELIVDDLPGVLESAVIGIPHADFGEAVAAVVVLDTGIELQEGSVISDMKDQVANFKVPKKVFFVDELPRNTMGKVQKNLLREKFS